MKEHYQRIHRSCNILRIKLPYSVDELCDITRAGEAERPP